jgi:hypothetical protein
MNEQPLAAVAKQFDSREIVGAPGVPRGGVGELLRARNRGQQHRQDNSRRFHTELTHIPSF